MLVPIKLKRKFGMVSNYYREEEKNLRWEHHCYHCKGKHHKRHKYPSGLVVYNLRSKIWYSHVKFDSCPVCGSLGDSVGIIKK